MREVWGWEYGDQSTVTVHVRRLREKVEPDPAAPVRIATVWGRLPLGRYAAPARTGRAHRGRPHALGPARMSPDLTAFALAGTTAVVGAAGALAVGRVARRSVPAATVSAPLVVIVSMAAGVLVCARAMFLSEHDIGLVLIVLAATVPVALVVGVLLSRQVRAPPTAGPPPRRLLAPTPRPRRQPAGDGRLGLPRPAHPARGHPGHGRGARGRCRGGPAGVPPADRTRDRPAGGMVDDLLALTSLHAGTTRLELTVVSLADLVSDTIATIRPLAQRLGLWSTGPRTARSRSAVTPASCPGRWSTLSTTRCGIPQVGARWWSRRAATRPCSAPGCASTTSAAGSHRRTWPI